MMPIATRVGTFAQRTSLVQHMMDTQKKLYETQTQLSTEKKSQTYSGISIDSFKLVNVETEQLRLQRFSQSNAVAQVRLDTMNTATEAVRQRVHDLRSEVDGLGGTTVDQLLSGDERQNLDNVQAFAFGALQDMTYYLNSRADGRYLFAGGRTDRPAVELPYSNLSAFQSVFDGVNVQYAESREDHVPDVDVSDREHGGLQFSTNVATGEVTAAWQTAGAFDGLSVGSTITLDDPNDVTVPSVSVAAGAHGGVTYDSATSLTATTPDAFADIPLGAVIQLDNGGDTTRAFRVTGNDGTTLTVGPAPDGTTLLDYETDANADVPGSAANVTLSTVPWSLPSTVQTVDLADHGGMTFGGETITFTSTTTKSDVTDIDVDDGSVVPTTSSTQGDSTRTETHEVTFTDLVAGDTVTIDGLTLTATGNISAEDVAAGFANLSSSATTGNPVANGTWSGSLSAGWYSGPLEDEIRPTTADAFDTVPTGSTIRLTPTAGDPVEFRVLENDTANDVLTVAPAADGTRLADLRGDAAYEDGRIDILSGDGDTTFRITAIDAGAQTMTLSRNADGEMASTVLPTAASFATVKGISYYGGDDLEFSHRVNESRSIDLGINAKNPAFEKAIRAMGLLSQGALYTFVDDSAAGELDFTAATPGTDGGRVTAANGDAFVDIPVGAEVAFEGATDNDNKTFLVTANDGTTLTFADPTDPEYADYDAAVDETVAVNADEDIPNTVAFMPDRIEKAMTLLNDAIDHDPNLTSEMSSDIEEVARRIGFNQVTLQQAMDEAETQSAFLDKRKIEMENVNLVDAATRLQDQARALDISFQSYVRISELSLSNYL